MLVMFSGSCKAAGEQPNAGNEEPSLAAGDGLLEVFGETATTSDPGERTLDDPAFPLRLEPADALGSCHNLDAPTAATTQVP